MEKGRLEAFSDGVIAIIITITVLLIDLPEGNEWQDLLAILPLVSSYFISFVIVGVNWVNHHHLLQVTEKVDGRILWANLLFLFLLSFIPVTTGWVGRSFFSMIPVRVYIFLNLACAISYDILERTIVRAQEHEGLRTAIDESQKELWSIGIETIAFLFSFFPGFHYLSCPLLIVAVAPWIIPDLRLKRVFEEKKNS